MPYIHLSNQISLGASRNKFTHLIYSYISLTHFTSLHFTSLPAQRDKIRKNENSIYLFKLLNTSHNIQFNPFYTIPYHTIPSLETRQSLVVCFSSSQCTYIQCILHLPCYCCYFTKDGAPFSFGAVFLRPRLAGLGWLVLI